MRNFLNLGTNIRSLLAGQQRIYENQTRLESKVSALMLEVDFLRRHASNYLGAGRSVTYLADEMPMLVNSNDFGVAANLINGGLYEQDNLDVILSFVKHDTVFLDIGANLGFFSLMVGRRLRSAGIVHAFEPHPELVALLCGSAHLNGLGSLDGAGRPICVHRTALGSVNGQGSFSYPENHLGGGAQSYAPGKDSIAAPIYRLDDFFPADFTFDVAKIDIEGGELAALEGMRETLCRSANAIILFEKLGVSCGSEDEIEAFFAQHGRELFQVGPEAHLSTLPLGMLSLSSGYFVACAPSALGGRLKRSFFEIGAVQFHAAQTEGVVVVCDELRTGGSYGTLLFHGPYWHLRRGVYEITVNAEVSGCLEIVLSYRYGHTYASFLVTSETKSSKIVVERDLNFFECIGFSRSADTSLRLSGIRFDRIG